MKYSYQAQMLAVVAALAAGCEETSAPICDGAELSRALGEAAAGETVRIGECRIAGSFTVPSGVTLSGAGDGVSVLESSGDDTVLSLEAGAGTTRVVDLEIDSSGKAGLVAVSEGGDVEVEGVVIDASLGLGAGFEGLESVVLRDVRIAGTVTIDNADEASIIGDAGAEYPTHGLVVASVPTADLEAVEVSGFSQFGVLAVESGLDWNGGNASANLRTGLMVRGGSANLVDVAIDETLIGVAAYAYAGVFDETSVRTSGVEVSDSAQYGLVHVGSEVDHTDLRAQGNGHAALWAQDCSSFSLSGELTVLSDNTFAGVIVIGTDEVALSDARIDATALGTRVDGEMGRIEVGDGVQLQVLDSSVTLRGLTLEGNERAGVVIDLGGGDMSGLTIEDVSVSGSGDELGVVAQRGEPTDGWDEEVAREGATEANDASFTTPLDVVTQGIPRGDRPDVIIGDAGLVAGIIGDAG